MHHMSDTETHNGKKEDHMNMLARTEAETSEKLRTIMIQFLHYCCHMAGENLTDRQTDREGFDRGTRR